MSKSRPALVSSILTVATDADSKHGTDCAIGSLSYAIFQGVSPFLVINLTAGVDSCSCGSDPLL